MKKHIYIIITLIAIFFIGVYIYGNKIIKSEKVSYNYKNCMSVQNAKIKELDIMLNIQGLIEKRIIFGKGIEILKTFDGAIHLNKEKYNVNLVLTRDDVYFGNAFKNETDNKIFTIFLSRDFKTIYLIDDKYNYEITSSKTIEEFKNIKKNFLR